MGHNNVIELNGKRYDANSGKVIGTTEGVQLRTKPGPHTGRVIDGIHKGNANTPIPVSAVIKKPAPAGKPIKEITKSKKSVSSVRLITPHEPEHPKTLMRRSVFKPQVNIKPAIKTQAPTEMAAKPLSVIVPKKSVNQVDIDRLTRAKQTPKHTQVKRFDVAAPKQPAVTTATHEQQKHITRTAPVSRPTTTTSRPIPSPVKRTSSDMFEAAIAYATSHEQPKHKAIRRRHHHQRLINISAGIAAFLILAGFIAYFNKTTIEINVASMKAGFHAEMPSYQPTGYALEGGIHTNNGKVSISFRSGTSSFNVTQQASNWDSSTLADSIVALNSGSHQTIQSGGRDIYIYNGKNATWVSNGVLYSLTGNADLSTSQIVSIATSM